MVYEYTPKDEIQSRILRFQKMLQDNNFDGTLISQNAADDLPRLIKEAKAGRVEFRLDKAANLHIPIGKASFSADRLFENFVAVMETIRKAKPPAAKGTYLRKITVASTMGPGIKVDPMQALALETEL